MNNKLICKCGCKKIFTPSTHHQVFAKASCRNRYYNPKNIIKKGQIEIWAKMIISGSMSVLTLNKMGLAPHQKARVFSTVSVLQYGRRYGRK